MNSRQKAALFIDKFKHAWEAAEVHRAYAAAATRFVDVLDELCRELPTLRRPLQEKPQGRIAQKMFAAALPFSRKGFITPMAAVVLPLPSPVLSISRPFVFSR